MFNSNSKIQISNRVTLGYNNQIPIYMQYLCCKNPLGVIRNGFMMKQALSFNYRNIQFFGFWLKRHWNVLNYYWRTW